MARGLLKNSDHLLAFLKYAEVEPTSNAAERSIRAAIQWRKICFGNQSKRGEVLTSRLLTITRTRFLQKKNVFRYLVDILNAHPTSLALLSLVAASRYTFSNFRGQVLQRGVHISYSEHNRAGQIFYPHGSCGVYYCN